MNNFKPMRGEAAPFGIRTKFGRSLDLHNNNNSATVGFSCFRGFYYALSRVSLLPMFISCINAAIMQCGQSRRRPSNKTEKAHAFARQTTHRKFAMTKSISESAVIIYVSRR